MKALSLTRPWADLVLRHGKDVENRTWIRWLEWGQPVLIHAAKSWDDGAIPFAREVFARADATYRPPWPDPTTGLCNAPDHHPTGIVGVVDLVSICSAQRGSRVFPCACGPWAMPDQFHWRLTNPRPFDVAIPCRGMPGLFTPPDDVLAEVARVMGLVTARGVEVNG